MLRIIGVGNVKNSSVWIHVARGALYVSQHQRMPPNSPATPIAELDEYAGLERLERGRGECRWLLERGGGRCIRSRR